MIPKFFGHDNDKTKECNSLGVQAGFKAILIAAPLSYIPIWLISRKGKLHETKQKEKILLISFLP